MKASEGFEIDSKGIEFYRCTVCGTVVSKWDIKEHHGCKKCGNPRIKPTNLTILEKIQQLCLHPAFWRW